MRFGPVLSAALALALLSGCAGYRLGPTNGLTAGERTVQISPFANQTMQPRLADDVTAALRRSFQRDGTFRLASRDGDIILTGVITRYERHGLSFLPSDVLTVQDYRVSVTAQVTARDARTGKVLLDRPVTGYTLVEVGSDLTSAERQARPLLAQDLARHITALLVDGSW